ncbi:hypothetical protein [Azorhizobium sp. AG788]|uniref:hypothetical protein n=1 Tax=Azorhizobium sp. AG788 TaxID=2183897 RepID=UPI00313A2892
MRLDMVVLGGLVVAASAAVFGDLGRAAAPVTMAPLAEVLESGSLSVAAAAQPACIGRRRGQPMATSLQFLEPGSYGTADLTPEPDCTTAR